jgi:hypothetical protein
MKYIFFFVTIYIHYVILTYIKLFDDPFLLFGIFLSISALGVFLYLLDKDKKVISEIGWGILSGSITAIVLVFGFVFILSIALSG